MSNSSLSLSAFESECISCSVVSDSFAAPWTVAHQAPLSVGFPRQEHWRGLLFPSPGDLPKPEIEPTSPPLLAGSLPSELQGKPFPFFKNMPINFILKGIVLFSDFLS